MRRRPLLFMLAAGAATETPARPTPLVYPQQLKNPLLPPETPLDKPAYWLSLES